jgi:hypothetical protein
MRERLAAAEKLPAGVQAENAAVLRHAQEMAGVPHSVTGGIMAADRAEDEDLRDMDTRDMSDILSARATCAELIVALQELSGESG